MKTDINCFYNKGYKIKIGYCIFLYLEGELCALAATSMRMYYSVSVCAIFDIPPSNYFKPYEGDFIIKTTRVYSDLEILNHSGYKSNYNFIKK